MFFLWRSRHARTYVRAYACMYTHAVDREQYSQTNTNANTRKLVVVMDMWAISACKRDWDSG